MSSQELLKEVLSLKPQERYFMVEQILKSLDKPDESIEKAWQEESERRVQALRNGRLKTVPFEEIFSS